MVGAPPLEVTRGVLNTPGAFRSAHAGKRWNPKDRVWEVETFHLPNAFAVPRRGEATAQ